MFVSTARQFKLYTGLLFQRKSLQKSIYLKLQTRKKQQIYNGMAVA